MERQERDIGTRLGRRVDHAAGRAAELGRVAAGLHVDALVEVEGYARRTDVGVRVRDVEAVDVISVFSDR